MPRVKGGNVARKRRKKVLKLAKGYFGSKHTLYKTAHEQVMKSLSYAYRDRRQRKRDFRKLWITRINAAARVNNISYSKLMHGLKLAGIEVNRKMLSDLAISDATAFAQLAEVAKEALANPVKKEEPKVAPKKEAKKVEPKVEVKEEVKPEVKEEPKVEVKEEAKEEVADISKMTVAALKELAKEKDVKLPSKAKKAEIVEILTEALK